MLTIECIDQPDPFYSLQKPWNALLERHRGADLLLTHSWFTMSWEGFCRGARLQILVVKEGEAVVGIAPLMIQRVKRGGIPIRKLTFLHEGCSYYRGDFLIPERTEEILEAMLAYLERKRGWEIATFAGIPEDSPTVSMLERTARRAGLSTGPWRPFGKALVLPIAGSWDDFLKGQGKHFRKNLKRPESKLKELGKVELVTLRDPGMVRKGIGHLYDIQMKNRIGKGEEIPESDRISKSAVLRLADFFSAEGRAEVLLLELEGKPIAGLFSILYRGCAYAIIIKHDQAYAAVSPGWTVFHYFIRNTWEQQAGKIDFLMKWPYVERWTNRSTEYLKIDCFHRGAFSRGIGRAKDLFTRLRSAQGKGS